jgi:predicted TIM-barrel fold metal-dependent hydrolase
MRLQLLAAMASFAMLTACSPMAGQQRAAARARAQGDPVPLRVDHHVHLNSPAIQAFLPEFCERIARFGGCEPGLLAPNAPSDLLALMARADIQRAVLLSNGYLPESPVMQPQRADAADVMRAANDWTVEVASRHRNITAFVAVDPLRPTALPEIARWRGNPAVAGIKLHLTAAGVDLRKQEDLDTLAAVFRAAAAADFAIVIHLRTQNPAYGAPDVGGFIQHVLPAAANTPVQIAHAGGWGGVDSATLSALAEFADAIEAQPGRFEHVLFDLSELTADNASPDDREALVALVRRTELRRFLPASDWPYSGNDLAAYYDRAHQDLPLTQAEWTVIRGNVAPYIGSR